MWHRIECILDIKAYGCAKLVLLNYHCSELFQLPNCVNCRVISSKPIFVSAQGALSLEVLPQPLCNDLLKNFSYSI